MRDVAVLAALLLAGAPRASAQNAYADSDKAPRSQAYASAVDGYNAYINAARKSVWKHNEGNLPFMMLQGDKVGRSIVLVHGLTDGPWYMRDLAKIFYDRGYNVVAVRLQGHGTRPEDLQKVTLDQWQKDVAGGIDFARRMGHEVSLAGFSTGAALVLDAVGKNGKLPKDQQVNLGDVFLFSPALELKKHRKFVRLLCDADQYVPGVHAVIQAKQPWVETGVPENDPHRYKKMASNAVCQLDRQISANETNRKDIDEGLKGKGVFIVESMADKTVDPLAVPDWRRQLPGGLDWDMSLYPEEQGVQHAGTTRSETNVFYPNMAADINAFIDRCAAANAPRKLSLVKAK